MRFVWKCGYQRCSCSRYRILDSSNCQQKCLSHSKLRCRWIHFVIVLAVLTLIGYNYLTSEIHLMRLQPKVTIQKASVSQCCRGSSVQYDECSRPCDESACAGVAPISYGHIRPSSDNAFFHETSEATTISYRQACAVESLALINPNLTVHLLMTGKPDLLSPTLTVLIENYPTVQITGINLADYVSGTPLERWYKCTAWNRGWFAVAHLSDALRFLSLAKYGGYYFDLDVIQLRPVTPYRNFVVAEDGNKLGSSVIHVDYLHPVMQMAVQQFADDYKWYVWAHNGPDLVTRVLQTWCGQDYLSWMTPERCGGFHHLPPQSFYPVHFFHWRQYFKDRKPGETAGWDESVTIGAHVWNSYSAQWPVRKSSNQIYTQMARVSCPKVFDQAPDEF